ncbi:MAG: hypothetical protein ACYCSS_12635 [Sulfuriferula sp.]
MKPKNPGSKEHKQGAEEKKQSGQENSEAQPVQDSGSNPMKMGMDMKKKMMAKMGDGGPMAMMQKMKGQMGNPKEEKADNPMQNMMGMCAEMLAAMQKTNSMAAFATPELHTLFAAWMENLEAEALTIMAGKDQLDVTTLAAALKINEESAIHIIAHLAGKGKAILSIRAIGDK